MRAADDAVAGHHLIRRERRPEGALYEQNGDLLNPFNLIVPDGQITELLSSPSYKNIPLPVSPKSNLYRQPSHPTRGAYRDRHGRGAGCGGRGSVGRCQGMAGRVDTARELTNGTRTNGAISAFAKASADWLKRPSKPLA